MRFLLSFIASLIWFHQVYAHTAPTKFNDAPATGLMHPISGAPPNSPIIGSSSKDSACGAGAKTAPGGKGTAVKAGGDVSVTFSNGPMVMDVSHKGPCTAYLSATGDTWTKIWEEGFVGGKFCTEKMIANNGLLKIPIPAGVPTGKYVLRVELLALHEPGPKAQWYVFCFDVDVTGGGAGALPAGIKIPGPEWASDTHPGVAHSVYGGNNAGYKIPGPPVAKFDGAAAAPAAADAPAAAADSASASAPAAAADSKAASSAPAAAASSGASAPAADSSASAASSSPPAGGSSSSGGGGDPTAGLGQLAAAKGGGGGDPTAGLGQLAALAGNMKGGGQGDQKKPKRLRFRRKRRSFIKESKKRKFV